MSHSYGGDGKGVPFSPALHQALISADAMHRASLDVLRDAICEYVDDLRGRGVASPEIASAIRRRVTDLGSAGGVDAVALRLEGIVDEMVASCLDGGE
jgi:hypothetical protein